MVIQLSEKLKGTFCTLVFDNLFNSLLLTKKVFEENIYAIWTVRSKQKHMPKPKDDKKMVRADSDFQFSKNVICRKWFDNKPFLLLATNIEGFDDWMGRQTWWEELNALLQRHLCRAQIWSKCTMQAWLVLMLLIKKRLHIN